MKKFADSEREIVIYSGVKGFSYASDELVDLFRCLDASKYKISDGELSIAFLSLEEMKAIHLQFLQDDEITDVITFGSDELLCCSGEICVSPEYAFHICRQYRTSFSDELTLHLVHGYLHLSGLQDASEEERRHMRFGESFCMQLLQRRNLIPHFSLSHI